MSKTSVFEKFKDIWTITKMSELLPYEADRTFETLNRKRNKNMKMLVCEAENKNYFYPAYVDFKKFCTNQTSVMLQFKFDGNEIHLRFISEKESVLTELKTDIQKYNEDFEKAIKEAN